MRSIAVGFVVLLLLACSSKDEKRDDEVTGAARATTDNPGGGPSNPHAQEVGELVVADLASNAFGNRKLEVGCVAVSDAVTSKSGALVVAARLTKAPGCGDDDLLWIFSKEQPGGAWTEGFLGPQPRCWKGVPDQIADAVAEASSIPRC